MEIEPKTSAQILNFIRERCEKGAEITISKGFTNMEGKRLWTIRGAGVDCSGWNSLTEAFERWIDAIQYLDERLKQNQEILSSKSGRRD